MPKDVKTLMASNPDSLGFIDSYWYWRIRAENTIMDPENLPKKNYKQLCRDMGLTIVNEGAEHIFFGCRRVLLRQWQNSAGKGSVRQGQVNPGHVKLPWRSGLDSMAAGSTVAILAAVQPCSHAVKNRSARS